MASDTSTSPWKIDATTFAGEFPGGLVTTQRVGLGYVLWTSAIAAANDQVILSDRDGNEIWRSQPATGADFSDRYRFPETISYNGLVVTSLPNGFVHFYYR